MCESGELLRETSIFKVIGPFNHEFLLFGVSLIELVDLKCIRLSHYPILVQGGVYETFLIQRSSINL